MIRHEPQPGRSVHTRHAAPAAEPWDVSDYLRWFQHWWWLILLVAMLSAAGAFISQQNQPPPPPPPPTPTRQPTPTAMPSPTPSPTLQPVYQASTQALVNTRVAQYHVAVYAAMLTNPSVLEGVIENLDLNLTSAELRQKVRNIQPDDSGSLLVIKIRDSDAQQAAAIANEMVHVFNEQNHRERASSYDEQQQRLQQELEQVQANTNRIQSRLAQIDVDDSATQAVERQQLQLQLNTYLNQYADLIAQQTTLRQQQFTTADVLQLVSPAIPPLTPLPTPTAEPTKEPTPTPTPLPPPPEPPPTPEPEPTWQSPLLAAIIGALLAAGGTYALEKSDRSVSSAKQVSYATGFPLLAETGYLRGIAPAERLLTAAGFPLSAAEPYHRILVTMGITAVSQPYQTILVTSSSPQEGKSTIAVNLALALAQSGRRVILVDANLHQPILHTILGCSNAQGLTSLLLAAQVETVSDSLLPTDVETLHFLPSGALHAHPATLFSSSAIVTLMTSLKAQADVIVFDSSALLEYADAALLATLCDTTIVVVRSSATSVEAVQQVSTQLEQSNVQVCGFVLNHAASASRWRPFQRKRTWPESAT